MLIHRCRLGRVLLLLALVAAVGACAADSSDTTAIVVDDGLFDEDADDDFFHDEDADDDFFDDEYCDPDYDDCGDEYYCDNDIDDCGDEYCDPDYDDCGDEYYCDPDTDDDTYPDCDDAEPVASDERPGTADPTAGAAPFPGGSIDLSATRIDIDCSEDGLGEDGTVDFTVAHYVVDGDLGARCFGDADERLVEAWTTLAAITPAGQLLDLGLFGGFDSLEGGDETTLAFVNTLDDGGSLFQMSVNLPEAQADPDEMMLTMAHEFTHVFTATSPQLDRYTGPEDCGTYFNGEGCYVTGSVMAAWIATFWQDYIEDVDPDIDVTRADGEERCALDAGFFGPYAASSPEEDFAEAFSAYVFRLDPDSVEQQQRLDWIDAQAGLAEFRDRAVDAGLGPLPNRFDYCGG